MDFKVDGVLMSAKMIELEILKDALTLSLGRNITNLEEMEMMPDDDKGVIRTKNLPKGDMRTMLVSQPVPLFTKASEEDFKELFISLRESAKASPAFLVLMVLSTMLATTGLFQSSAPVIIGAMILAPLMGPIISLSMGVVRAERSLVSASLKTLFYGIVLALAFSCFYTYLMPLTLLTDEMRGRLNPNILDLMVAIISGIAGAYANAKSEVAKSLAGVAIAVALVPPLSVTGIGLGWGEWEVIYGSFLLFITNLVGITLAAALTFIVLGYAPIYRAKKGLWYTSAFLFVITIPLVLSFIKAIEQNRIYSTINEGHIVVGEKEVEIHVLEIDLSSQRPEIYIETESASLLQKEDLEAVKASIESELGSEIVLDVTSKTKVR